MAVTLVLTSLKLDTPGAGKGTLEGWLSGGWSPDEDISEGGDSCEKIAELYHLHLLPHLGQWDLVAEFLQ